MKSWYKVTKIGKLIFEKKDAFGNTTLNLKKSIKINGIPQYCTKLFILFWQILFPGLFQN